MRHTCDTVVAGAAPGESIVEVAIEIGDAIVAEAGCGGFLVVGRYVETRIAALNDACTLQSIGDALGLARMPVRIATTF